MEILRKTQQNGMKGVDLSLVYIRKSLVVVLVVTIVFVLGFMVIKNHIGSYYLCKAVEEGNIKTVEKMLKYGSDPNCLYGISFVDVVSEAPYKKTPLQIACYKGNLEMVEMLLEHGADVNYVQANAPISPLMSILWHYREEEEYDPEWEAIVDILLQHGADVNYKTSPYTVARVLIDNRGKSQERMIILKKLHEAGADLSDKYYLWWACYWKHEEIIKYLLENCGHDALGGETIVRYCRGVDAFSEEMFLYLFAKGADPYITVTIGEQTCNAIQMLEEEQADKWPEKLENLWVEYNEGNK